MLMILIAIIFNDLELALGSCLLAALVGHGEVHVILAKGRFGRNVDVLMELNIADSNVFALGKRLLYLKRAAALLVYLNVDALDDSFSHNFGL